MVGRFVGSDNLALIAALCFVIAAFGLYAFALGHQWGFIVYATFITPFVVLSVTLWRGRARLRDRGRDV